MVIAQIADTFNGKVFPFLFLIPFWAFAKFMVKMSIAQIAKSSNEASTIVATAA